MENRQKIVGYNENLLLNSTDFRFVSAALRHTVNKGRNNFIGIL